MKRRENIKDSAQLDLYNQLLQLHSNLDEAFREKYDRSLPLNETLIDRWERAKKLGFGAESSIYDSALVIGKVEVGKKCWIGPFTIIDGSGGLVIGDGCTISAGVHIYSHDNVKQTLSNGICPIERTPVSIGNNTYIGPNVIISKGVSIGNYAVIGANTFIKENVPDNSIVVGQPGRIIGKVKFEGTEPYFDYNSK